MFEVFIGGIALGYVSALVVQRIINIAWRTIV